MKELLEQRNRAKARKPRFLKQACHVMTKLEKHWRAPRGQHSKFRKKLRSYRKQPGVGYSSPKEVRGLTREGHELIIINNVSELKEIKTPIVIGSTVGKRKRLEIINECKQKKIEILNINDVVSYEKNIKDSMKKKKEITKKKEEAKAQKESKKKKESEKETKQIEKKTESKDSESKKAEEQKEKKKILEKKE